MALAEAGPLDEFERVQVDVLRAQISFAAHRGSEAPRLLLKAAKRLEPLDARLAREIYLDALSAALFAGRLASEGGLLEVAQAARVAAPSPDPGRAADLLLDGLALVITQGDAAGACLERRCVSSAARRRRKKGTSAGCGSPAAPPGSCGTMRAGTSSPLARSRLPVMPARSACSRSP